MFIHLAHPVDPEDVAYVGEPVAEVREDSVIGKSGKPFNSSMTKLPNHFATHMDGPHHFNTVGDSFNDLPVERFGFEGPDVLVADIPQCCAPAAVVKKEDLEPFAEQLKGKRLLLLRSGFEKYKKSDPTLYQMEGPSLHPDLCKWLNEEFPELDCLAMDWLSVASPTNDYGPEAHHWLLGNYTDHIITAIEDMPMAELGDKKIKVITLGPLRVTGVDSSQVCAMACVED